MTGSEQMQFLKNIFYILYFLKCLHTLLFTNALLVEKHEQTMD